MDERYGKRVRKHANVSKDERKRVEIVLHLRYLIREDNLKKFMKFYKKAKKIIPHFDVKEDNGYNDYVFDASVHPIGVRKTGYFYEHNPIYLLKEMIKNNRKDFMNFVIEQGDASKEFCLEDAALLENKEITKMLIEAGADINFKSQRGLCLFGVIKNKEMAKVLIDAGIDVNRQDENGNTPLCFVETKEVAEALIEAGADINHQNKDGETPLHLAKNKEVMEALFEAGANLNLQNNRSQTPLHVKWMKREKALSKVLIKAGADVNLKDENGETILLYASVRDKETFNLLLEAGADVNTQNKYGMSALHFVEDGTLAAMLLEKGANPNLRNKYGETPLFFIKNKEVCKILIKAGADLGIKSKQGRVALDLDTKGILKDALEEVKIKNSALDKKLKEKEIKPQINKSQNER